MCAGYSIRADRGKRPVSCRLLVKVRVALRSARTEDEHSAKRGLSGTIPLGTRGGYITVAELTPPSAKHNVDGSTFIDTTFVLKVPVYLELSPAFEAEKRGNDKGDTATRIKCPVTTKRRALNWGAVFSSHCVYLRDFERFVTKYNTLKKLVFILLSYTITSDFKGPRWSSGQTTYTPPPSTHLGEPGSIPGGVAPGFSHVGTMPDDVTGSRVFSGISRFPRPCIPALLHTIHLASSSSVVKTSMSRAAQISPLRTLLTSFIQFAQYSVTAETLARLGRRSDEAQGVRARVARIAPSPLDLGRGVPTGVHPTLRPVYHDAVPAYLYLFVAAFEAERCGSDKDHFATRIKYTIVVTGKAMNWLAVFSSCYVYLNRIRLERAFQKQASDTHNTLYDRVKRCRERRINIKASERVNVDVFMQNKRPCPNTATPYFIRPSVESDSKQSDVRGSFRPARIQRDNLTSRSFLRKSPTSVQSMSRQSQYSRVLQAPSRTVGFARRFHTLSSIHATNTSLAVVPQSPVVLHTSLRSRTPGEVASVTDCRPLGCGSIYSVLGRQLESSPTRVMRRGGLRCQPVSPEHSCIVANRIGNSSRREEVCDASKSRRCRYSRREAASHERIVPRRGEGEVGLRLQRGAAETAPAAARNNTLWLNIVLCTSATGAAVAERLARSPPTKVNRAPSLEGSRDFRKWESCRTMPLVGGFFRRSPVSPAPSFRCRSIFTSITLIGSQGPSKSIHSLTRAAVAERLACSPTTKAIQVEPPDGSPDFRMWDPCRMTPFPLPFHSGAAQTLASIPSAICEHPRRKNVNTTLAPRTHRHRPTGTKPSSRQFRHEEEDKPGQVYNTESLIICCPERSAIVHDRHFRNDDQPTATIQTKSNLKITSLCPLVAVAAEPSCATGWPVCCETGSLDSHNSQGVCKDKMHPDTYSSRWVRRWGSGGSRYSPVYVRCVVDANLSVGVGVCACVRYQARCFTVGIRHTSDIRCLTGRSYCKFPRRQINALLEYVPSNLLHIVWFVHGGDLKRQYSELQSSLYRERPIRHVAFHNGGPYSITGGSGMDVLTWGTLVVRLLASHLGEPSSIPDRVTGFSHVGIGLDDAPGRRARFPPAFYSGATPHSPQSPSSALKTSLLRAAQISSLT
ncbi:hypothetical protein PR048_031287 [Dryococelus australis]|uniref:Uncharacterized protein n=1 Tax=Dryococelus australis TaxID=614101 RepID=A0ABQ9G4T7_9NEOP|nr:hypothetical protein PR048_031287 [Dryococelus australis]